MPSAITPISAVGQHSAEAGAERRDGGPSRRRLLIVGGCDVHFRIDLIRALTDHFEVVAAGSEPALGERFAREGIEYHSFPLGRGASPLRDLVTVWCLHRIIRRVRPEIVHAFASKPSVWGRIAARLAGVPVVVGTIAGLGSLYSTPGPRRSHHLTRKVYEGLQRVAARCSDMTVFQNDADLSAFRRSGIVRVDASTLVPGSGVRTEYFDRACVPPAEVAAARATVSQRSEAIVVAMVARVIRSKGVLEFAAAAELLRDASPPVEFVLIGPDDSESGDGLTAAERNRLSGAVRWIGPRSDVRALLAAVDIFVLASYYREGVPRALLEAASMSLPLVTTRTPGCADVVEDGVNGFVVEPRDPEGLARAIGRLAADARLRTRFGHASRHRARALFDLRIVAERTLAIYASLLRDFRLSGTAGRAAPPGTPTPSSPPRPADTDPVPESLILQGRDNERRITAG